MISQNKQIFKWFWLGIGKSLTFAKNIGMMIKKDTMNTAASVVSNAFH